MPQNKQTMNTKANERIKGYCCEVNAEQWGELVKVAYEVGVDCEHVSDGNALAAVDVIGVLCRWHSLRDMNLIPFPDFLAKLRGDEGWQPKVGEMVEVKRRDSDWEPAKFICVDSEHSKDWLLCYLPNQCEYHAFEMGRIRKARPTITRAEAEARLNARIID